MKHGSTVIESSIFLGDEKYIKKVVHKTFGDIYKMMKKRLSYFDLDSENGDYLWLIFSYYKKSEVNFVYINSKSQGKILSDIF